VLPRTRKLVNRHRMILTIHNPISPKGKGVDNIKAIMEEAYVAVESALPAKYKEQAKNSNN
ncbi:1-acyl-sn-glycerol-3-phosphate acyltransferase, partial [termite gut metagenome]